MKSFSDLMAEITGKFAETDMENFELFFAKVKVYSDLTSISQNSQFTEGKVILFTELWGDLLGEMRRF